MTLVVAIGGVRSGKSAWAERQAEDLASGMPVTVFATADPADASMADRVTRHQNRRPDGWIVRELYGQEDLAAALPGRGVTLLDGLGGWVASLLEDAGAFVDDRAAARSAAKQAGQTAHAALHTLIEAVAGPGRVLVVVSEETGLGVVPLGAGTAAWVDLVGELNQRLVGAADQAVVVVAGRALPLTEGTPDLARPEPGPPLTVIRSDEAPAAPLADDRERRAHPRLMGATPGRPLRRDTEAHALGGDGLGVLRAHGDRLVQPGDVDHAVNVVGQGPPTWITEAFTALVTDGGLTRYPDAREAEAALAELYGRPAEEVVATNGAAQALWLLPAALRPRRAVCIHPLFTEAEAALRAHGVPVVRVHRDPASDFALDPAAIPTDADLVILGNPTAASGTLSARETILRLRRPGRTIVVDEAFMDLVPGEPEALVTDRSVDLIVVRSFTKSLSIPGVRCGVALAPPALAARLRAVLPPWSVNAFAIAALMGLAEHPDELGFRAERAAAERADLTARLAGLPGAQVWPSRTNHVLLHLPDGGRVAETLRAQRIVVRPCGSFPGLTDDHLRITAREAPANAALVAALAEAIAGAEDGPAG